MSSKEFVKISVGLREHPKVLQAGDMAGWLFVCAIMWSKEHDTDGFVPEYAVGRLTSIKRPMVAIRKLVEGKLLEPVENGWVIHDYLEHQESSERRRSAAKTAAKARWDREKAMRSASDTHAIRNANALRNRNAEEEEEEEKTPKPPEGASSGEAKSPVPSPVQRAQANGFDEWLLDHASVTGDTPPKASTKLYRHLAEMFNGRIDDGLTLPRLKMATRGAFNDELRRKGGHYGCESVLRPTKCNDLANKGQRLAGPDQAGLEGFRAHQRRLREQAERDERAWSERHEIEESA